MDSPDTSSSTLWLSSGRMKIGPWILWLRLLDKTATLKDATPARASMFYVSAVVMIEGVASGKHFCACQSVLLYFYHMTTLFSHNSLGTRVGKLMD